MSNLYRVLILLVAFFGLGISCASAANVVSFDPQIVEMYPGSSQEVQIVMDEVPDGLSGFNITISILDPEIAEITAVSFPSWGQLPRNSTIPSDSVWIKVSDLGSQVNPGDTNVLLGIITVTGKKAGTADLDIPTTKISADGGSLISATIITGNIHVLDNEAPVISSVSLSNSSPHTGNSITVTVDVTDNVGVSSVVTSGVSLVNKGENIWEGSIVAVEGTHKVSVTASDSSGNVAVDESASYTATTPDTQVPVISSVSLSSITPHTGDLISVIVDVTDNVGVSSVVASGVSLVNTGGNTWEGNIVALEGTHKVSVTASDAAGNTAVNESASYTATTPDTEKPVIHSVFLSDSTPNTGDTISVTVNVTDNVGITSVEASGVSLVKTGGNVWEGNIVAVEGTHKVIVSASDASGNTAVDESASYTATTLDNEAPVINSVVLSSTTPETGDSITVTVDVTDNVGVSSVAASGVSFVNTGGNVWKGNIVAEEGTHKISVSASDAAGNVAWDNSTSYTAITSDTEAPVINSVALSNNTPYTSDSIVVTVDVTDNAGVSSVVASGVSLVNKGSNVWEGNIVAVEGTHKVSVIASDSSGNTAVDESAIYTATTPDTEAPVINSISLSDSTPETGDSITVTVDVTDNVGVSSVVASGVSLVNKGENIWEGSIVAVEGTHKVSVSASDIAGNVALDESASYTATTTDTEGPVIHSVSLSDSTPNTGDIITVNVEATDNVGVRSVVASGVSLVNTGGNVWKGNIVAEEGTHKVSVTASDAAGNTAVDESASYTATTPDTEAPVINSVSLSNSTPETGDSVTVTVDVTDNVGVSSVVASGVSLVNKGGSVWEGDITAVEGTHTVSVTASDTSGNIAVNESASYTATTPDTQAPIISSVSLSSTTPETGDSIVVTVEVTDNVGVSSVEASGVSLVNTGGNVWVGNIVALEGTHTVSVSASDASGNVAVDESASYTATTLDNEAPVINSVILSSTTPKTGDSISVIVDVTDNVGVSSVVASGGSLVNTGTNVWEGNIVAEEGTHKVSVTAADSSGNTAVDESVGYTATTPDTEAPVISSVTLSNSSPYTGDFITVTVDVTDNVGVTSVVASGVSLVNTGGNIWEGSIVAVEGTHTVSVTASDASGNIAVDESASYTAINNSLVTVEAEIYLSPDTLKLGSGGGWVTVYIELPEGYDVAGIDASSVLLNGAVSAVTDPKYDFVTDESEYLTDIDLDGISERMFKFDRKKVESVLKTGDKVTVTFTGKVEYNNGISSGTADFEGSDVIKVIESNSKKDKTKK